MDFGREKENKNMIFSSSYFSSMENITVFLIEILAKNGGR